ncbi:hypothetical protein ASPWEDRAFT_187222 [Aspergillus wentii DTO 134E9]|uniref:Rhodopsin domain-containing protein n=1 Tax=Aspergillus wentii DTO 134E9 TaxID=1073089 RepID=A0A1L9R8S9_ASPWE|nr:uncharacterized protein ASPWEDRAFT_187222 [Aspergillus wentii DTO 134E9]KAI9926619.1 hypothetical protein MW887_004388 [Aspergillus wentii]OJJ31331.1 hypothetical protein ASPWEDRAFT_187222 [Aspergillus wentii DTO 134E9]
MAYNLNAELWTEFAIGMIVFAVRFYARWDTIGLQKFSWDDFFSATSAIFWTLETTFLYTCALFGNNIGLNPETAAAIPDSQVPQLVKGSKHAYAAWIFYILLVWSLKGVVIFLYSRITTGLWQHRLVKLVSVFSVLTFLASILLHFGTCVPIQKAWQIKPYPGDNCTKRQLNYIVIETLNIITDVFVIAIPMPIVFAAQIPIHRKLILSGLFSSGVFVIICAILRAYYSVRNIQDLSVALGWASREVFVSALAVSAPGIKPLFNKSRWFSSKKTSNNHYGSTTGPSTFPRSYNQKSANDTTFTNVEAEDHKGQFELSSTWQLRNKMKRTSSSESQERIIEAGQGGPNAIQVTTEYHVQEESGMPSSGSASHTDGGRSRGSL